ncbi:MAG: methyl-accepting chemotaxis protein [Ktedonobacteraceae bacterium]|nr:methyl-accepting chemotaxis protein [Ktedonobacteraceae bacterium]
MNPDRNRGGMTVSGLMYVWLAVSAIIPVLALVALAGLARVLVNDTTAFAVVAVSIAVIVLFTILITHYLVTRKIKDRFLALVDVCREYSGSDRSVRAAVNGDDDFAMLTVSLNTLLDSQNTQGGMALSTTGSDAAALQAQIEKLLQEVSAVGDGDLRVQAEVTPDTLGVLADSFNYMIEELAKVVGRVQSTAVQVTNATRRILDRSAELAQASEMQVDQISQTSEAVEALAIFIQNVARNAQMSHESAQDALRNANSGQQAVRQTIDGMMLIRENVQETAKKIKRLGERSNEIGEIVRIIEDIADQTNLLALNAAIQSAMAGEHGRGFAVVADEIRLLAERSTESTKRIATLVKSIQGDTYEAVVAMEDSTQEVVKGSQLADEAGRALNSIYSAVERQAQMIENIARAANEQTSVSEAVAVAMNQISEITRQTNAGTQEAAASVSYLAELSDQLRASVSTFRLPDRVQDSLGNGSGAGMVPALPAGNPDQFFATMGSGVENSWGQGFSGNFPPLPEPDNADSLVALSSRTSQGQFSFNNQQDFGGFGGQQGFGDMNGMGAQPAFGNQPGFGGPQFGGQQDFGNQQPSFGSQQQQYGNQQQPFGGQQQQYGNQQQPFGNQQQPFGGQQQQYGNQQQPFGNQQDFGGQYFGGPAPYGDGDSFRGAQQPAFGGQQDFGGQAPFGNAPAFGGQGQSFYPPANQLPPGQQQGFGQPPQPGQAPQTRQRRPDHQQSQPGTNQDQVPFPNNGQFGQ